MNEIIRMLDEGHIYWVMETRKRLMGRPASR